MNRSASPTRTSSRARTRAARLRAQADAARARLEALADQGKDYPQDADDLAVWRHACRALARVERALARAKVRARLRCVVRRLARERRAAARLRLLLRDAEAFGRTAVYCRGCERPGDHARGAAALRAQGWGGYRDTLTEGWPRLWWCPACWVPPRVGESSAQPPGAERTTLSSSAEADAGRRSDSLARARVERLVRHLAALEPERAERALRRLVYGAPSKVNGRQWRRVMGEVA